MAASVLSLPQDVLARICSYLYNRDPYSYRGNDTLSVLARTCIQWHDPAISVLWQHLHNIVPLLYTLPADLCITEARNEVVETRFSRNIRTSLTKRFARTPTPDDFNRWYKYAALVRDLTHDYLSYSSSSAVTIPPDTWRLLSQHGPRPFVHCLRTLDCREIVLERKRLDTGLYFASTLHVVRLYLCHAEGDLADYVDALAMSSRDMQELSLEHEINSRRPEGVGLPHVSVTPHMLVLTHLRELRIVCLYVQSPMLALIRALPSLQSLKLWLSSIDYPSTPDTPIFQTDGAAFAKLRELEVDVDQFSLAVSLLGVVSSWRMRSLVIRRVAFAEEYPNKEPVPPPLLGSLFSTLASHPSREVFQCLKVDVDPLQAPCDLSEIILPLLTVPSLSKLEIKGWSLIVVDAATLESMSYAWPRLEQLVLHQPQPILAMPWQYNMNLYEAEISATPWETTLTDLIPLATRCPLLETIALSVNTWPDVLDEPVPLVRPEDSSLTRLYVGYDAEPGEGVAAFLGAVFPHLKRVGNGRFNYAVQYGDVDDGRSRGWNYVRNMIAVLDLVRRQERSWAA
ncbi:hypothetical protein C8T65DRAFT_642670 [Cerioporus squamosus]|nr:hypothetical protein C8T65DRAFT_642670 [Cerioporus squamosus]